MYTEQDKLEIRQRIRKYTVILGILLAALLTLYVIGMIQRWEIGVMVIAAAIFAVICFMLSMFLLPCLRYKRFLKDMTEGLSREMVGSIVEISEQEDYQDGVRVYPVRILLKEEQDERIVYINVSKADRMPGKDVNVRLNCFGRHIREVVEA